MSQPELRSLWREPSAENLVRIERWFGRLRIAARASLRPFLRISIEGLEHVPKAGPVLVLANHATLADPITVMLAARRPIQWMGTETLLKAPWVGPIQRWIGTVPKQRFTTDVQAVWLLRRWCEAGAMVGVFPEGERSWSGRLQPLVPAIAGLVRLLGVPVVLARMENHYRQWPRWTPHPRQGTVVVSFQPPRTFERSTPPEQIRAWIEQGLSTDPRGRPDLVVRGVNLARGLSNLVFLCPSCHAEEAMVERGNWLECKACSASWKVDSLHRLVPSGMGEVLLLEDQMERTRAHFARRWAERLGSEAPVFTSLPLDLMDHTRAPRWVGRGRLVLRPERLELAGWDDVPWSVPLEQIDNANVEFQRFFELHVGELYYKARIPRQSAWKWPWAMDWWRENA